MNKKIGIVIVPLVTLLFLASCNKGGGDEPGPLKITSTKGPMILSLYLCVDEIKVDTTVNIKWSKDKKTWINEDITLPAYPPIEPYKAYTFDFELKEGESIYLAGDNPDGFSYTKEGGKTRELTLSNDKDSSSDAEFKVSGNVMSLIDSTNYKQIDKIQASSCFTKLFTQSNVVSASDLQLPCKTLSNKCYMAMFDSCSKLTDAPNLPAITLADSCYRYMFDTCTSLVTAPTLPATTLADSCYRYMFDTCTSLTDSPILPATTLAEYCYNGMFSNCTNLTTAPELPATTLVTYCYDGMFDSCSSLKISENDGTEFFTCPKGGAICCEDMFFNTGGTFTDTPTEGNTYYWY